MSHIINLMFFNKFRGICDNPRAIFNYFINPFTMPNTLRSFFCRKDSESLPPMCFFITGNPDNEVDVRECGFSLLELAHVSMQSDQRPDLSSTF